MKHLQFLDGLGWPVERIESRPFTNLVRLLIHTRRVKWVAVTVLVAWTYTASNGVQAWTDDPERIPLKYAAQAEHVEVGDWADYPRLSVVVDSEDQED